MTREEAQKILRTWLASGKSADGQRGYIEGWFDKDDAEAFRMAIGALQDTPTKYTKQPLVLTCDGCRHVGTYDTDFPCSGCIRKEKDYYEQER